MTRAALSAGMFLLALLPSRSVFAQETGGSAEAKPKATNRDGGQSAAFALGGWYGRAIDIPVYGAELLARWEVIGSSLGGGAELTGFRGRSQYGLSSWRVTLGGVVGGSVGALRLGAGFYIANESFSRATNGGNIDDLGTGVSIHASYDLWSSSPHALFIGTRLMFEVTGIAILGGSLSLGYRADFFGR